MTNETEPDWTHKGLFFGIVPIKICDTYCADPTIAARGVPEFFLTVVEAIAFPVIHLACLLDPFYEPSLMIKITGEY